MVLSLSKFLKHYDFLMEYDRYILLSSVTTFLRTETWIETKLSLVTVTASIAHIPHTCSPNTERPPDLLYESTFQVLF